MADQAQATLPAGTGKTPEPGKSDGNTRGFPPKGQPLITGINRIGLWSLYIKEVRRFLKVQTQTIWAPAVTTLLFLVIFTVAMGRRLSAVPHAGKRCQSPRAARGATFCDY